MGNLRVLNKKIYEADITTSDDIETEIIDITSFLGCSYQVMLQAGDTLTLTAEIWVSNQHADYDGFVPEMTLLSDSSVVIAAEGSQIINPFVQYSKYVQLRFSSVSGTGHIRVDFNTKQN